MKKSAGFHSLSMPFNFHLLSQPHLIKCSIWYTADNVSFYTLEVTGGRDMNGHLDDRWIIISIVSTLKQNHRKFCTFLQTVKMQFNMGKTRNESIYSATWLSICFSMLALSLPYIINLSDFQLWEINNQFSSWWHLLEWKSFQKIKMYITMGEVKKIKIFFFETITVGI